MLRIQPPLLIDVSSQAKQGRRSHYICSPVGHNTLFTYACPAVLKMSHRYGSCATVLRVSIGACLPWQPVLAGRRRPGMTETFRSSSVRASTSTTASLSSSCCSFGALTSSTCTAEQLANKGTSYRVLAVQCSAKRQALWFVHMPLESSQPCNPCTSAALAAVSADWRCLVAPWQALRESFSDAAVLRKSMNQCPASASQGRQTVA